MLSVTNSDSSHDIRQGRRLEMRIGRVFGQGLKNLKSYNSNADICQNHRRQVWVPGGDGAPPRSGPWRGPWYWAVEQWRKLWYGRNPHKLIGYN